MGSYPYDGDGKFGALLVLRTVSQDRLEAAASALRAALSEAGLPWADVAAAQG
jgi:hypothetical protein